jgi:2'-5' RNA ligase
MSPPIRSFIAIELPDAVLSRLDTVQQELKSEGLKVRWVRPQNIHLTLNFLGNVDPADVEKIDAAMAAAVGDFAPFRLKLGGMGVFPGIRRPRVIWVGLGGEMSALQNLQRSLAERLATIGFPKEKKSFKAHLTLGRVREAVNPNSIRQLLQNYSDLGNQNFRVDRIILFKSDLKPSGAVYSHLEQANLGKLKNDY